VLGGAFVPCLLEKRETHYRLVSHAYVEGMMLMECLPDAWRGTPHRIEIK